MDDRPHIGREAGQAGGRAGAVSQSHRPVRSGGRGSGITELTAKHFSVAVERVFRSGETPQLKLTSRNIEELTVEIYSIDLETYFRKMHLARGVEGLDIALIDPDKTFQFKTPNYAEYKQTEIRSTFRCRPTPKAANDPAARWP